MKAFDLVRPSSGLGQDMAYCNLCSLNFSVTSGGLFSNSVLKAAKAAASLYNTSKSSEQSISTLCILEKLY